MIGDFPIQKGHDKQVLRSIPWSLIAGHERQAQLNHSQTLRRLEERHGLSPCEALAVIEDRPWARMDPVEAEKKLADLVAKTSA